MDCSTPGFPVHHQLPELAQTQVRRVGDAIQPSHPLLSPSPPAFNLSQHQGLFAVTQFFASNLWPNYWSFSFISSLSNEYSGLTSFRIDWLDLLAVQGTLKSFSPTPQFKSINFLALSFLYLEKEMATHSSTLAWKIPWTEEPGRPCSPWGCEESDTTEQLHFHFHFLYSPTLTFIHDYWKNHSFD